MKNKVKDPVELKLISSLMDEKYFTKKINIDVFCDYLKKLATLSDELEFNNMVSHIKNLTNNPIQLHTLDRVVDKYITKCINKKIAREKNCPHCGLTYFGNSDTKYVICGYSVHGYDWKGCSRDWCFECGKKLCKMWATDQLFNTLNRKHNKKCCRYRSHKTNNKYPDDYCQCNNDYVNRCAQFYHKY